MASLFDTNTNGGVIFIVITTTVVVVSSIWYQVVRREDKLKRLRRRTKYLTELEIVEIQVRAPSFTEKDLRRLFIRYMNLDTDRSGT